MSNKRGFFFWAAAFTSGIAMGSAVALSRTPVVAAYIGGAIPIVVAIVALLSRPEKLDGENPPPKAFSTSVVSQVSGFVFVFFLATLGAAAIGMSIRPTESLIASVDRDLQNIGITEQENRTATIIKMLESGAFAPTGANTRPQGPFLYYSTNDSVGRAPEAHATDIVDCSKFSAPPWNNETIGRMRTFAGSWTRVATVLTEIERSEFTDHHQRTSIHRAVHALIGC